jgi:tetratricopeptide (TPR) repeat protein
MGFSLARQRALVGLLPVLVTLPRFWNGFVFDDVFVIERSDFIHRLENLPRVFGAHTMIASSLDAAVGKPAMDTYRPISIGSFFLDALLSGRSPWAYHLTNTLLHAACCLLFFTFLRAALRTTSLVPLQATLLFALAPWLAEAHVWINGRSDLFLTVFVLLALLAQRRALAERSLPHALLAGAAMLCALWSKEIAVCALPFVALVPLASVSWRERAFRALPLLAALVIYLGLRMSALEGMRTHSDGAQLAQALFNLPLLLLDGIFHVLLPTPFSLRNLRDDYATLPRWLSPALGALALLLCVLALRARKRHPLALWALGLALATLAPACMISTALWPGFGRYLYLPALALFTALADLYESARANPRLARAVSLGVTTAIACSGALLLDATLAMHDEQTMYSRAFSRAPTQAWTIGFLGLSRKREGHCDEAVPLLAVAEGLAPEEPRYAVHLARCLAELGQLEHARNVAQRGQSRFANTRAEPGFLVAELVTLSPAEHQRAERLISRCLAIEPNRPDCLEARAATHE